MNCEIVRNKVSTATPVSVMGADIDISLVTTLTSGDQVLMEMNGNRIFSSLDNPLIAEEPWTVVDNDEQGLILSHPTIRHHLTLPYANMLRLGKSQPAVFQIENRMFAPGPLFVVLQFIAYRSTLDKIDEQFPVEYDAGTIVSTSSREEVIQIIVRALKSFTLKGWQYKSICRFALRSNVRAKILQGLREENWDVIKHQNNGVLCKIVKELGWLRHCLGQNEFICSEAVAE